jgi:dipeptidyl aminopeptidase/acylaminoacyl peptidase
LSKRPVSLEDLYRFQLVGDVQIDPAGERIVYTVKRVCQEKNKYFTRLYMADLTSKAATPFTGDNHGDSSPRWSPDGKRIAFLSNRDKPKSQIFIIPSNGGEAEALTKLDEGSIEEIVWSPDGKKIAFQFMPTPDDLTEKAMKEREEKGLSPPVRFHNKLSYREDGGGYLEGVHSQIWIADATIGEAKPLVQECHHCTSLTWSPDSSRIAFLMNPRDDDDIEHNYMEVYSVGAEGGLIEKIETPAGYKQGLAWSPNGEWVAFASTLDPEDIWGGKNERVAIARVSGGEWRDVSGHTDRETGWAVVGDYHEVGGGKMIQWSPDSQYLYFPTSQDGDTGLCRISIDGGEIEDITAPDHEISSFSLSADGTKIGLGIGNATDFYEAQIIEAPHVATGHARPTDEALMHAPSTNELARHALPLLSLGHNIEALAEIELQMPDAFETPSPDGSVTHGWVLYPPNRKAGETYPCVIYVHGGPAAQYAGKSAPFHELQWLAANGFVVVFSNPRGSKGYGEAHCSAIHGDWGNVDWIDIQAVSDWAAALPEVDSKRMAIMGGSYGGYMTAWAIGHTNRYKCAIADRLVSNLHSMSGTTDFGWNHGRSWKGNSWSDPSDLWRESPLAYAGNIETPLLLIHSDGDLRCPVSQAEEMFAALREQRKVVEFVRYPANSSHGMSRNGPPDLRIDRLKRNLEWLERWLK